MSRPSGATTPPERSDTATTFAPIAYSSPAATEPTLPKPWIATRASRSSRSMRSQTASST